MTQAYLTGVIPLEEYQRRRREMEERDQVLQRQEQELEREVDRQAELADFTTGVVQFCQRVQEGLEQATFEQKRALIELLIDRVIVTNGEVEIRYVIPTSPKGERIPFCHLHTDYLQAIFPTLVSQLAQQNRRLQFSDTNGERHLHQVRPMRLQELPIDGILKKDIDMLVDGLFLRTIEFEVFPVANTRHQLNPKQIGEGKKSG